MVQVTVLDADLWYAFDHCAFRRRTHPQLARAAGTVTGEEVCGGTGAPRLHGFIEDKEMR